MPNEPNDFPLDYSQAADCEQGSEFWAQLRCGLVTASRASDVIAVSKKGEAAVRRNYRAELISEILTNVPYPQYVSQEMRWGSGAGALRPRRLRNAAQCPGRNLRLHRASGSGPLRRFARWLSRRGRADPDQGAQHCDALVLADVRGDPAGAHAADAGRDELHPTGLV